jgi:hypothetical protein
MSIYLNIQNTSSENKFLDNNGISKILNIIIIDFLIQFYLVFQSKLYVNKVQIKNVIYTILCHLIQVELLVAVTVELNIML